MTCLKHTAAAGGALTCSNAVGRWRFSRRNLVQPPAQLMVYGENWSYISVPGTSNKNWNSGRVAYLWANTKPSKCLWCRDYRIGKVGPQWSLWTELYPLSSCCCCCSVSQWCPTLCDPGDCSTLGFPVLLCLLEFAQTHVHWVGDAIQPADPLSPSFPPALNLSQHKYLFQWVSSSHQLVKVLELQHQSFQWIFRVDFL